MLNKINHDKILQDLDNDENQNYIKEMEDFINKNNDKNDNKNNDKNDDDDENDNKLKSKNNFLKKYNYIIILLLVFMLLNNKSIIELIYCIPFVKNKIFLNLLIRTIIFGLILTLYNKLK